MITEYVIEDQQVPFFVNASGTIIFQLVIDKENIGFFEFNITASDAGTPMLSSIIVVRITITYINDNAPMFDEELVIVKVLENVSIGHPLATISASDVDIGNNAMIQYRLLANEATVTIIS